MKKIYINPLPVRIWHWANAVGFVLLIATGLQIRYAGQMDLMSFKTAVDLHNWIGFVLIGNFYTDEATQHERQPEGERGAYYFIDDVNIRVAPPGAELTPKPAKSIPPPPKKKVEDHASTNTVEIMRRRVALFPFSSNAVAPPWAWG